MSVNVNTLFLSALVKEEPASTHLGPLFLLISVEGDMETLKSGLEIIKS